MLHKVDVANVISGLRPLMKQATTHLAHHHSKEIAKLESGKGKNAEKRRRKAETLRLEMVFLPKVVLDEVSKYALMMDFSQREKLLGDVKLPLETKVMIKLSTSKPVVSFLESFRSTHPEWKEKLPGLIETLGIYTRNKKKVKKNIEKSERKMARKQLNAEKNTSVLSAKHRDGANEEDSTFKAPKKVDINQTSPIIRTNSKEARSAKVAEDSEEGDSDGEDNEEGDSDGEDSEEGCSDGEESGEGGSDGEDSDEGGSDGEDSEEGGSDGEGSKEIGRRKNQDNTKPLQKKRETHVSSGSVFAEVRRFADLQMEANSERKLNTISSRLPSSDLVENVAVEEDNFFLTEGNSFLKTVSVNRADGEGLGKKVVWSKEGKNLAGNRRQRRAQFTGKELDQIKPKRKAVGNRFDKTNERKSSNYASGGNKNTRNCDESNSDETLHPSWAAKRNQRISLNSFQGKKIVFNDNQTAGVTIPSSTDETLHPSWAAKRSQKLSLDSFKGKKIRFDDD